MQLDGTRYRDLLAHARVRERALIRLPKIPTELELQARWFAGDFGREFQTVSGDKLEIVQLGFWNREAGPDFQSAAVRLNGAEIHHGPIEIDLIDRNWESHGHATNPAFDDTILHVFLEQSDAAFFTRTSKHRNVPQLRLDISKLQERADGETALAHAGRCVAPLKNLETPRVVSILDAAAQYRLQRKARDLAQRIESGGREETLFQAFAEALGYKQNRLPFTILAQRVPLSALRKHPSDAEALLFGVAGFLTDRDLGLHQNLTRSYLRSLWDQWWKYREQFRRLILPASLWKLSGSRPLNHPHRRLGALVTLVSHWRQLVALMDRPDQLARLLTSLEHDFWSKHYTLRADRISGRLALIGRARAGDILANIIYPLALLEGHPMWDDYKKLSSQLLNQAVRIAAIRLFADDPRQREFLASVAGQQGLLQIYEDFCLRDASDCADCPFPEQLRNWR